MQENEFEKRAQKVMEEWKVRPSVSVWQGVEKRIQEKKRRKRWLLIRPMLAGLALSGYFAKQYFFTTNKFQSKVSTEIGNNNQDGNKIPLNSTNEKQQRKIKQPEKKNELINSSSNKKIP